MVLELWTPNRLHAAHLVVLGSAGALVLFGALYTAHSPTRRRSWFMPQGTTRAQMTTHAAILPSLQPLPSIEPRPVVSAKKNKTRQNFLQKKNSGG